MLLSFISSGQRLVTSLLKKFVMLATKAQDLHRCPHLDATIFPVLQQLATQLREIARHLSHAQIAQELLPHIVINWSVDYPDRPG